MKVGCGWADIITTGWFLWTFANPRMYTYFHKCIIQAWLKHSELKYESSQLIPKSNPMSCTMGKLPLHPGSEL